MNRGKLAGYAAGSIGTGVFSTVPGLLLLFFMTDILGVGAALAGIVVVAPKALDVLANPVVGAASDREASRTFRRTRFLMIGAIALPIAFAVMFLAPVEGRPGAAWVAAAFVAASLAFACFQVPYVALPAEMSPVPGERLRIMTWRIVCLTLGILVAGGLAPVVVDLGGGGRAGYALMGVVIGVVVLAACLTATLSTRWVRSKPDQRTLGLVEAYRTAKGNRPFFLLMATFVLQAVGVATMLAAVPYVATYRLGDNSLTSPLFVCVVAPSALAVPLWSSWAKKYGRVRCYAIATVVFAAAALAMFPAAAASSTAAVLGIAAVAGFCYAALQVLPLALMPDAIVADEARTGQVQAGAFTGAWTAGETAGLAVGPGIYAAMLAAGGFLSSTFDNPVAQPDSARLTLLLGFTALPAALMLVSLPTLAAYRRARTTSKELQSAA
jgi:Na+/melibiose symporter-like transporter